MHYVQSALSKCGLVICVTSSSSWGWSDYGITKKKKIRQKGGRWICADGISFMVFTCRSWGMTNYVIFNGIFFYNQSLLFRLVKLTSLARDVCVVFKRLRVTRPVVFPCSFLYFLHPANMQTLLHFQIHLPQKSTDIRSSLSSLPS